MENNNLKTIYYKDILSNDLTEFKNVLTPYFSKYDDTFTLTDDCLKSVCNLIYDNFSNCYVRYNTKELFLSQFAIRLITYFTDFQRAVKMYQSIGTEEYPISDLLTDTIVINQNNSDNGTNNTSNTNSSDYKSASNPSASNIKPIDDYYDTYDKSSTSGTTANTTANNGTKASNESHKGDILARIRDFYKFVGYPYPQFIAKFANLFIEVDDRDCIYYNEDYLEDN